MVRTYSFAYISCGFSFEKPCKDASYEHPKHIVLWKSDNFGMISVMIR